MLELCIYIYIYIYILNLRWNIFNIIVVVLLGIRNMKGYVLVLVLYNIGKIIVCIESEYKGENG